MHQKDLESPHIKKKVVSDQIGRASSFQIPHNQAAKKTSWVLPSESKEKHFWTKDGKRKFENDMAFTSSVGHEYNVISNHGETKAREEMAAVLKKKSELEYRDPNHLDQSPLHPKSQAKPGAHFIPKIDRPSQLRSHLVDKYVFEVLSPEKIGLGAEDEVNKGRKMEVVRKIYEYNVDNRIFNNMRQTMNLLLQ
jgi:hypothetical protein